MELNLRFNISQELKDDFNLRRARYQSITDDDIIKLNQQIKEDEKSGYNIVKTQRKVTKELLESEFGYLFDRE